MGMGTQARQLHSLQTGLGLCVRACVCTPLCVRARVCSPHLFPQDAWLVWAPGPLFLGRREFPVDLPAENWLVEMCIW